MAKNRSIILLTLLITLIFIFASCITMKLLYPYNGINYDSPDKSLAVQKADLEQYVSKILPTTKPVGGSIVMKLPSIKYIKNNFVTYKGPALSEEMKEDLFNFTAAKTFNELRYLFGEALERRKIFDKVVFLSSDDPENASFSEELSVLYFKKDGEGTWFLKRKGDITKMFQIESISAALPPVQMLNVWLDKVEKAARNE